MVLKNLGELSADGEHLVVRDVVVGVKQVLLNGAIGRVDLFGGAQQLEGEACLVLCAFELAGSNQSALARNEKNSSKVFSFKL